MARKAWFVSKIPLPLTSISLGRFVTVPKNPPQNFFDPQQQLPTKPSPTKDQSDILDVSQFIEKTRGTKLELVLASFASSFFDIDKGSSQHLTTCRMTRYFVLNVDDWFDLVCQEDVFRTWLERQRLRKRKIYLVTEYCTLTQPSVSNHTRLGVSVGGSVQIPVAAAAGIPIPTPLDPSISIQPGISNKEKQSYHVANEKVFWVAYQEVKVSRSKQDDPDYRLSDKRSWVELCSIRDANSGDFNIDTDLEDIDIPTEFDQLEADSDVFFFEK